MPVIEERERLIRDLARLRWAERSSPAAEEIATVRGDLERALGPTVPRAMTARLLGVSQTALDRWIGRGDVPAFITPSGRREVPLCALVDLLEAVAVRERTGDDRDPLAAVLRQRRSDAERLDLEAIAPPRGRARGHRAAELRSLAYHRAVARRLDEAMVRDARQRVRAWRADGRIAPRYAEQWDEILSRPPAQIAASIAHDSPRMAELRQSSPFAGMLSEPERRRVLEALS